MDAGSTPSPEGGTLARALRRAVTIPAFVLALLGWTALLPVTLPLALAVDLARRRRWSALRFVAGVHAFLAFEVGGVAAVGLLVLSGRATWERLYALEARWADALLRILLRLFSMRIEVSGLEALAPGPFVLVGNHVSVADALLPAALVTGRAGIRLRYVAKAELLWDPCVDLAGHLLPNVFVRRGAADTAGDLSRVVALLDGMGEDDGIVLFPEGTRFTPARREAMLARRAAQGPAERLERDRALRRLMPPRVGGLLALFEKAPGLDLVVMAHTGLEGLVRVTDLWRGTLVGRTLRVDFRRAAAVGRPPDREGRIDWIYRRWEELDAWLLAERGRSP